MGQRWGKDGAKIFAVVLSDRTRGNKGQLKNQEIPFKCEEKFLAVKEVEHRHRLPRETVTIFRSHLDMAHEHPTQDAAALSKGVGLGDLQKGLTVLKIL